MTPPHKRKLTSSECRFNLLARFADDPRALIVQQGEKLTINFSGSARRASRKGSFVDLRYVRQSKKPRFAS